MSIDNVLGVFFLVGVAYASHRYWRSKAISCAASWLIERGLKVTDWATSDFEMHRQSPAIAFTATNHLEKKFDIKLRFRFGFLGDWRIDEVAYWCESQEAF